MKRGLLSILIGFCVLTGYAETSDNEAEVIKLLRQISDKLTSIDKRLQKIEKTGLGRTATSTTSNFVSRGSNIEKLSKIKYPSNPTKENVKKYVREILFATKGQKSYSSRDMQVRMFEKVGNANLDVLISALKDRFGARFVPTLHLEYAIKNLAKASDKELIIKSLPNSTSLVDIVVRYGWEKDVRKILIDKLYTADYLPISWISAVASFKDPKTYGMLKEYFITHSNRMRTYEAIKDLPGIKLDDAVDEAFSYVKGQNMKQQHNQWQMYNICRIAVGYGKKEALEFLLESYGKPQFSYYRLKCMKVIQDHVGFEGSINDKREWFKKNKKDIVFDKKDKKFKLKSKVSGGQGGK